MKTRLNFMLAVFLLASTCFPAEPSTPPTSDLERAAILEALRIPVQTELKKEVMFSVGRLNVMGDWAFLEGVPIRAKGLRMDYNGTPYEEAIRDGDFEDGIYALLRKQGGKWTNVRYVIGATDLPYLKWPEEFHAPAAIFPNKAE